MIRFIQETYTKLDARYASWMKVARFIVSGGTAAVVDLALLFALTDFLHVWYLLSAVLAFVAAFMVSFTLQKYWTFRDRSADSIQSQAVTYFVITGINLGLNTLLVYFFVEVFHFHYMIAQIVASLLIAFESYFAYQAFVFKKK